MAEDRKFYWDYSLSCFRNRVTGEAIPSEEPVIIFRGRDQYAIGLIEQYYGMVQDEYHKACVAQAIVDFRKFRAQCPDQIREPGTTRHMTLPEQD